MRHDVESLRALLIELVQGDSEDSLPNVHAKMETDFVQRQERFIFTLPLQKETDKGSAG